MVGVVEIDARCVVPDVPQQVVVVVVELVVVVHRFPAAGLVLAVVRRWKYLRRCFNDHDIPALDYLARLWVVNAVSLVFLTVTAEPALPGFVAQLLGVDLDMDESSCADYLEKAQVSLFAVEFLVWGLHAKS